MRYVFIFLLIGIDQIIKVVVRNTMTLGESIPVLGELLKLTYIENKGMAFGMMAGKRILLTIIPIMFMALVFFLWHKYRKRYGKLMDISVAMILAGGISNVADRIILGSVTDYIDLQWFAIFNFADICAVIGCILLCICIWFCDRKVNNG